MILLQLSKYIEPIKRMIENTSPQETAKLIKIQGLLEILENPNRQYSMDLLIKCEHVLEKLEINQHSDLAHGHSQQQQHTTHKEYQVRRTPCLLGQSPHTRNTR